MTLYFKMFLAVLGIILMIAVLSACIGASCRVEVKQVFITGKKAQTVTAKPTKGQSAGCLVR